MRHCVIHAEDILKTVMHMRQVVFSFCDGDVEGAKNAFRHVFDSERHADEVKGKF